MRNVRNAIHSRGSLNEQGRFLMSLALSLSLSIAFSAIPKLIAEKYTFFIFRLSRRKDWKIKVGAICSLRFFIFFAFTRLRKVSKS